jgi:hypothetical protein
MAEAKQTVSSDLRIMADIALDKAKAHLTKHGKVTPIFIVRLANGELFDMELPEVFGDLMNDGSAKDRIFGVMRELVKKVGLTAVIFVTEAWMGLQTPEGAAVPPEEFDRITRERGFETALSLGFVTRCEVIFVSVQTPEGVLLVRQPFERDDRARRVTFKKREDSSMGVDDFQGRQKMYGDLRPEWLG